MPIAIRQASHYGDSIVTVGFEGNYQVLYSVHICIRGIDHNHLLSNVVACVTERQNLSISHLVTETTDRIVNSTIDFSVHSVDELHAAMESISQIRGIDEIIESILNNVMNNEDVK